LSGIYVSHGNRSGDDCSLRLVIDICHTLFAFVPDNLDYGLRLA
jgi:hypothetical protein